LTRPAHGFTVAAVQMRSTSDRKRNLNVAEGLAAEAAGRGAVLAAFPENVWGGRAEGSAGSPAEPMDGPTARRFAAMAARHHAWILAGTIALRIPRSRKRHNASILFAPDGSIAAVYRKMHLFDVAIPGRAVFRESSLVEAGDTPVVASTPLGVLGLSVCYDLRFPELYRQLALAGATVLFVPSAFTAYTGRAHWTALLRARAIENLAYVVAPAQWGLHHAGRRSYGHTSVIDPWGKVIAELVSGTGVVLARIDLARMNRLRRELPVLTHVRRELLGGRPGLD
jgi:deaminated glutathione amidase